MDQKKVLAEEVELHAVALSPEKLIRIERKTVTVAEANGNGSERLKILC
jgi:hypothetical protein